MSLLRHLVIKLYIQLLLNIQVFATYSFIHEWLPECYFSVSVKVEKNASQPQFPQ